MALLVGLAEALVVLTVAELEDSVASAAAKDEAVPEASRVAAAGGLKGGMQVEGRVGAAAEAVPHILIANKAEDAGTGLLSARWMK